LAMAWALASANPTTGTGEATYYYLSA